MTTGFYEDKGMIRSTMIVPQQHKDKVVSVAKTFKITQGEVIEVLLDQMDVVSLRPHFEGKRKSKCSTKSSSRHIIDEIKGLTCQERQVVVETIAKLKSIQAEI